MSIRTLALCAALGMGIVAHAQPQAPAQPWPVKPITVVVPQPAGGLIDSIARGLSEELAKRLGVTVLVDNKPGASGMIGVQAVAHANPDGYTLLVVNHTPVLTAPFVFSKVPYDVRKDLSLVTQIAGAEFVLAVGSDVPATNMSEFVAWAKRNRGTSSYGSPGVGTYSHLASAYLAQTRDIDMTHVPFKGETPMVQELLAGRIVWGVSTVAPLIPHVQSGRLRALGLFADHRKKELPNVPTMAEAGLTDPEFKPIGWIGLLATGGTPAPILERIEREARQAIKAPAMQARLASLGLEALGTSSAEFRGDFESSLLLTEKMVKISGAKLD